MLWKERRSSSTLSLRVEKYQVSVLSIICHIVQTSAPRCFLNFLSSSSVDSEVHIFLDKKADHKTSKGDKEEDGTLSWLPEAFVSVIPDASPPKEGNMTT